MSTYENQNTLFLTEKFIKENSAIQDSVEFSNLRPTIRLVQDKHVQRLLGTKLYRKLQTLVADGTITDSGNEDYKYLLDAFIVHIITHAFMAEATTDLLFKYTNISVNTNSNETIQPVSLQQIKFLQEEHKGNSQFYQKRLVDYLLFNQTDFPEYLDNVEDELRPERKAYSGNIYTGKFRKTDGVVYPQEYTYDLINKMWNPQ